MACGVHTCTNHNLGTTTCSGHRAACSTNRTMAWSTAAGKIYASDVDSLRTNLRAEIDAYNNHTSYSTLYPTEPSAPSGAIHHDTINNLSIMVNQMYGSGSLSKVAGNLIDDIDWQGLINKYNALRQNCICNSDCSCNNVCACYGDCGCNYSDERLKENIQFIETKNGLNIYSWNYVWDKAQRFVGVMAQEILKTKYSYAVVTDKNGYYMVNYNKLPV